MIIQTQSAISHADNLLEVQGDIEKYNGSTPAPSNQSIAITFLLLLAIIIIGIVAIKGIKR